MNIRQIFKNLHYFLPDLRQSWILLGLTAIVGTVVSVLATTAVTIVFPSVSGWPELLIYPFLFIPPAVYIYSKLANQKDIADVTGNNDRQSIPLNKPSFGKLGGVLSFSLLFPLVFAFNIATEPLSSWMGLPDFMKQLFEQMKEYPVSAFISVAIFAPLLEEILCRGIILRGLLAHYPPSKAILWSAAMFAIMHMNPWQAVPAFLMGIMMGWIYYRTRSIWAVIFIHFINNSFSFIITAFFPGIAADATFSSILPGNLYYLIFVASVIYTAGVIYLMNRHYDKPLSIKIQANS